jgi:hypothetical protein
MFEVKMQLPDITRENRKHYRIDDAELEGNPSHVGSGRVMLFHGSKSGIIGDIKPISRVYCDFGKGFYMGTERIQTLTLICNYPNSKLYTVKVDVAGLKILDIVVGIDWALLIAYNRGKLEHIRNSSIYQRYAGLSADCDLIIGNIANDRMFMVLDRFFSGEITDAALINSLSALKLGRQYVAITEKACQQIQIIEVTSITEAERIELRTTSEGLRKEGILQADEICKKYRRDGRFFDEILEGGIQNGYE